MCACSVGNKTGPVFDNCAAALAHVNSPGYKPQNKPAVAYGQCSMIEPAEPAKHWLAMYMKITCDSTVAGAASTLPVGSR